MKLKRSLTQIAKWISFLLLLLLVLLPVISSQAVTYAIKHFLHEQGFTEIVVRKLWVNPYTGRVAVEALEYADDSSFYYLHDLEIDLALMALASKKIEINHFSLDRIALDISESDSGQIRVNGIALPSKSGTENVPDPNSDAIPAGTLWHYSVDEFSVNDFDLHATVNQMDAKIQLLSFSVKDMSSQGDREFPLTARLRIEKFKVNQSRIELTLDVAIDSKIKLLLSDQRIAIESNHRIDLTDIDLILPDFSLQQKKMHLLLNANVDMTEALSYQLSSDMGFEGLTITASATDERALLDMDRMDVFGLSFSTESHNTINLDSISVDGLSLLASGSASTPTLVADANAVATNVVVALADEKQALAVAMDRVEINRANLHLLIDERGELTQLATVKKSEQLKEESAGESSSDDLSTDKMSEDSALGLQIKEVRLGPDIVVEFQDHSVSPPYFETLTVEHLNLSNFDLTSDQMATVSSSVGLSHSANLSIDGTFNAVNPAANITAQLKKFQLYPISGYAQKATGYALESGDITIKSNIVIEDQTMNLDNKILIDQLNLRPANENKTQQYAKKLTMPLDQALDLLRDSNNIIELEVPVSGPLNDPNINIDSIINKALAGALKQASISVLKFMLQPYSTVFAVAKFANDQVNKVRLEPVVYDPGVATMNDKSRDYAQKIAKILQTKKSLKLKVCGSTNGGDLEYLTAISKTENSTATDKPTAQQISKQLNELAHNRSAGFRRYLIDQLNVNEENLLICLPMHGVEEDSVAGIELLL